MSAGPSFKGKGAEKGPKGRDLVQALDRSQSDCVEACDIPRLSVADAKRQILIKRMSRERIRDAALTLIQQFSERNPDAMLQLVRSPDRSNTFLRWRFRATSDRRRTELGADDAIRILGLLPQPDVLEYFDFEYMRLHINLAFATCTYDMARLENFVALRQSLDNLRRRFGMSNAAP